MKEFERKDEDHWNAGSHRIRCHTYSENFSGRIARGAYFSSLEALILRRTLAPCEDLPRIIIITLNKTKTHSTNIERVC